MTLSEMERYANAFDGEGIDYAGGYDGGLDPE